MRGVRIKFNAEGGSDFDFSRPVKFAESTMQNVLVNIGTQIGSDPQYPERGTALLHDGLRGRIINRAWADASAAGAAAQTLKFMKEEENSAFRLANLKLNSLRLVSQQLELNLWMQMANGETLGQLAQI